MHKTADQELFSCGSDIGQLPVLDPAYRPAVMPAVGMYFKRLVDEYNTTMEACATDTSGKAHLNAFDAMVLLSVLRAWPDLVLERDTLRAELQARADGNCRRCSNFHDGGFFLPDVCHLETKYADACRERDAALRELASERAEHHHHE